MKKMIFYSFVLLMIFAFTNNAAETESKKIINNGGFEQKLKNWQTTWLRGGISQDAHSGKFTLKLTKQKNKKFDRLKSAIKVEKGKLYEVTFWTKGKASSMQFLLMWGPKMAWCVKTLNGSIAGKVTDKWTRNRFVFKAPQEKINIQLRASGKTGYVLIDDIKIVPVAKDENKSELVTSKPRGEKIDYINWGRLRSRPYLNHIYLLADANLKTNANFQKGAEVGGTVDFFFPNPIFVTDFRFVQGAPGLTGFKLAADTNGDGKFDKVISEKNFNSIIKGKWLQTAVDKKVYALSLIASSGSAGYRTPYPNLYEVEIYSNEKIKKSSEKINISPHILSSGDNINWPNLIDKPEEFDIIVSVDFPMMGLDCLGKNLPEDLNSYKHFQKFVKNLKKIRVNTVRLLMEMSCCKDVMPWPSKICPHTKKNLLKKVIDALHANGIKVYTFLHAWISPLQNRKLYGRKRYGYPYEQSDRSSDPKKTHLYPCVISDNDFSDKWLTILKECAAQGADGVYLYPDEYYYKGHSLVRTKCSSCQKAFKEMFGYSSLPSQADNSEKYRKWKLFEYRQIIKLGQNWQQELHKLYPDIKTINTPNVAFQELYNKRLEHGVCADMLNITPNSAIGGCDGWKQLDIGSSSAAARRYKAFAGDGKTYQSITLFFLRNDSSVPMKYIAPVTSSIMNKINIINLYRYDYIFRVGWAPFVERAFKMARLLQTWGAYKGDIPTDTCVLLSRSSEDWWEIAIKGVIGKFRLGAAVSTLVDRPDLVNLLKKDNSGSELKIERFRGHIVNKSLEGLLLEKGIPYKVQYTDMKLKDLSKYKLLIMPFAYSLSKTSFEAIKAAVDSGTKLLIIDMLGETNEYGVKYSRPLLKELLGKDNVHYMNINLAKVGMDRLQRAKSIKVVEKMLPANRVKFDANGSRVEFVINEISHSSKILFLANWEKQRDAVVTLSIPMVDGNYNIEICDSLTGNIKQGRIDSKTRVSASVLKNFSVKLKPGQLKLIKINQK